MVTDEMGATYDDFILYTVGTPPKLPVLAPLTEGYEVNEGEPVFIFRPPSATTKTAQKT